VPGIALLIGSDLDGLTGVEWDIDLMEKALKAHGFASRRCVGDDATRAGILTAYEKLIADVGPADAAVVYYSGHGGLVQPPAGDAAGPDPMDLQFIAPRDFHDSTPGDFRGITSVELSVLLARLTQKTDNATVIFDCCHAAHMSRHAGRGRVQVRALPRLLPYDMLLAHIDRLRREDGLNTESVKSTGNAKAVRIVACAPDQSAFEYPGEDGKQVGMLTESLALALAEAGAQKVTWATVLDRVRRRVLDLEPGQRPEAEGPSGRLLFETAEADLMTTLPVAAAVGGRGRLEGAPLLGVRLGDTFVIMPPGAVRADTATKVGDLVVDEVGPMAAEGAVTFKAPAAQIPLGARAHRVKSTAPTIAVLLPQGDQRVEALERAVADTPMLRVAAPGETWTAAVRVTPEGGLKVEDGIGPLHATQKADEAGIGLALRDLKALAQAAALRMLTADSRWALGADVDIEWGLAQQGSPRPLPAQGASVDVGDRIYISVRNKGAQNVYVSLIDIAASSRIKVLTRFSPSGEMIRPGGAFVYGFDVVNRELTGAPLSWPRGLDPMRARPETVMVLIASDRQDVTALEQTGVTPRADRPMSPLESLLHQVATGRPRDIEILSGPAVRYDVHTIDFVLGSRADEA